MTSSESGLNDVEAGSRVESEHDDLPSGSERELFEYYFNTKKQRIEGYWSDFRRQRLSWQIDFFNDLHKFDILDLIYFIFI